MPTQRELEKAIEDLLDASSSYKTCEKLAVLMYLRSVLFPDTDHEESKKSLERNPPKRSASMLAGDEVVTTSGGSEFLSVCDGVKTSFLLLVFDDLMSALSVYNPRLYTATLEKLKSKK